MQWQRFASDSIEAVVLPEAGARLHRLRVFGRDLLRTPDDPARHLSDPFYWGAYVMAPWCNRLPAGPMRFGSRPLDLPASFPDGTAIHGQVYARPWTAHPDATLAIQAGGDGWPWHYEVTERIGVTGATLKLALALFNRGDEPMPGGIGIHPWFVRAQTVAIHADRVFADNLHTDAEPLPVSGTLDLRQPATMAPGVDATWTALSDPAVELRWRGVRATMRVEASSPFIVAANPRDLGALAVEAQTHAPQGLRRLVNGEPGAMTILQPGEMLSLTVLLEFAELPSSE